MGSYVDAYRPQRQARYHWRPAERRSARRLKLTIAATGMVVTALVMSRVAYGGGPTGMETVVVQPGQTLWSIAAARYPDDDPRSRIDDIVRLNNLGSQPIHAGETISVPAR
jgi:hypothetical protein